MTPPAVTARPTRYADSCLTISSTLIDFLASCVPHPNRTLLSIGSGSGMLESLVQASYPDVQVCGVEVSDRGGLSAVNKYLSFDKMGLVKGTWEVYDSAGDYSTWAFIYPREPRLVSRYVGALSDSKASATSWAVNCVVWAGPRADWEDFAHHFDPEFSAPSLHFGSDIGLMDYEMCAVFERRKQASSNTA